MPASGESRGAYAPQEPPILLVGAGVQVLAKLLTAQAYAVHTANNWTAAREAIQRSLPDAILLATGMEAYAACQELRADARTCDVPVLFVEPPDRARVFAVGGTDYVTGPLLEQELMVRLEAHLEPRARQRRRAAVEDQLQRETVARAQAERSPQTDVKLGRSHLEDLSGAIHQPVLDADRLGGAPGVLKGVTKRTGVDEEVLQQNEFLTNVLESLTHPFYVIDANDYTIRIANSAARAESPAENLTCHALTHGRSTPCGTGLHPCPLEAVKRSGKPVTVEHVHFDREGNRRHVEVHAYPRFDRDGKVAQVIEYSLDITDRVQAEEALREARDQAEEARRQESERRREADRRRRIAESLADVLAALNSSQSLDQVLDRIALQARRSFDSQAVAIFRLQGAASTPAVQAGSGLPNDYAGGLELLPGHQALSQSVASGQPVEIPDLVRAARDLGEPSAAGAALPAVGLPDRPYRALLAVPIVAQGKTYGGIAFYYTEPRAFSREEVELAAVFSNQVALAVENARLRQRSEEAAADAERSRLARDLHDSVTQALFSASLVAEVLPAVWRRDADEGLEGLEELRRFTRSALSEMRTLLLELRPRALVETSLDDLLRQLAEAMAVRARLGIKLDLHPIPALPPEVQVTFYRVAQEALQNAAKHAAADAVTVSLTASPPLVAGGEGLWRGQVVLQVSDNGLGFDPEGIGPGGLGLGIMRERAEAVGARLSIEGQLGHGTRVSLVWQRS